MPQTRDLTLKQKKFLKVYFETGNATKAALEAYDTDDPNTASAIGAENLVKLKPVLVHLMEKKGLDLQWMVDKVHAAGDATKWNDFTGEHEADHTTRLKAVEVAERWLGVKEKEQPSYQQTNVFNISDAQFTRLTGGPEEESL